MELWKTNGTGQSNLMVAEFNSSAFFRGLATAFFAAEQPRADASWGRPKKPVRRGDGRVATRR